MGRTETQWCQVALRWERAVGEGKMAQGKMVLLESCCVMVWPGRSRSAETTATSGVKSPLSAGLQGSYCTSRRTSRAGDAGRRKAACLPNQALLPELSSARATIGLEK